MTVRVDRRPRARRTTRGPPMREARYGSPPQVCRPRRDREGLENRRPERQAMMTVVVITTVVAGVHRLPVWGAGSSRPIFRGQSRTRCGAPGPFVRLPPNRWPRRATSWRVSFHQSRAGDVGPRNRQRGILPPENLLVEHHPRNQIRRYLRRAATSGFRSGAGEAQPAPSWRADGVG